MAERVKNMRQFLIEAGIEEILAGCKGGLREQIVEISVGYVRFLM